MLGIFNGLRSKNDWLRKENGTDNANVGRDLVRMESVIDSGWPPKSRRLNLNEEVFNVSLNPDIYDHQQIHND